jgi:phage terminase large subunit GpA-like protein
MLAKGEWRTTSTGDGITKSYHLPSMYSPAGFLSWKKMVREWLKAVAHQRRGDNTLMIDFINLRLGEAWEEVGEMIKKEGLLARAESIDNAPAFGPLVASVDVQGDRLESLVVGFGRDEESWDIEWRQFQGDPDNDDLWMELDRYLQRDWVHASGRKMPIECVTIDSGGHHTEKVYAFCKPRIDRRVFAVKGGTELARPLVEKPSRKNRYRTPLFTLCVDTGKDRIYSRLKIDRPGPGYIHFPAAHWFDEEFVAQLTAERKIPKWLKGKGAVPYWKKIRDRNEALDLSVYALAALYILDGGLGFIDTLPEEAERWATKAEGGSEGVGTEAPQALQQETLVQPVRLQRGWVNNWRGSR